MTDEAALLAAILASPDEDTPRLVYADWLTENGQPERGEFIRVQCELARIGPMPENEPQIDSKMICEKCDAIGRHRTRLSERKCEKCGSDRVCKLRPFHLANPTYESLRRREKDIWFADTPEGSWSVRGTEWFYQHLPWLEDEAMPPGCYHRPERGFIPGVTCSWNKWRDHADAILARQPVRRVTLTTRPSDTAAIELLWTLPRQKPRVKTLQEMSVERIYMQWPTRILNARWPGIEFTLPPSVITITRDDIINDRTGGIMRIARDAAARHRERLLRNRSS